MLDSLHLVPCPHCKAIPTSTQARFCGKCGKPLLAPPLPTAVLPVPTSQTIAPAAPPQSAPQIAPPNAPVPTPGSPLAVITPAFPAPITPAFDHRPRRIRFACVASPIIGVGLGAEPAALIAIRLIDAGLPDALLPIFMAVGFSTVTALIAYIIMADKLAFISALVNRRRIETINPDDPLAGQTGAKPQLLAENPHQWAKQEDWKKSER